MKTAIVGSRNIENYDLLKQATKGLKITMVISGGAAGVDKMAERYAIEKGLPLTVLNADWQAHGKSAGMIRNAEIVKTADQVIAIWDGQSKGTAATINMAKKAGKAVKIFKTGQERQMSLF
jgi:YspA, cpYpsA-related SLOG family